MAAIHIPFDKLKAGFRLRRPNHAKECQCGVCRDLRKGRAAADCLKNASKAWRISGKITALMAADQPPTQPSPTLKVVPESVDLSSSDVRLGLCSLRCRRWQACGCGAGAGGSFSFPAAGV